MTVHMNKPSGEPRPGAQALCGAEDRHGLLTTYSLAHVDCEPCRAEFIATATKPAVAEDRDA